MEDRRLRWPRVIVSLQSTQLRCAWLASELRALPVAEAASTLEAICLAADSGEPRSITLLHALVQVLADDKMHEAREELRAQARRARHLALERMLRRPFHTSRPASVPPSGPTSIRNMMLDDVPRGAPDYGGGRPLTLGERKAIARRPPPELLHRVLADPHPDVIANVLCAPRLTEDDVVALVTRRPNHAPVLAEVAKHPRWCQRARIRFALVMNPVTPPEVAIALLALLPRHEVQQALESTTLHPAVRAAARERFALLPPLTGKASSLQ